MDTIVAAIIGAIGGIVATIILAFRDELRDSFSSKSKQNKDLVGRWRCEWYKDTPSLTETTGEEHVLTDAVTISKVSRDQVSAIGENLEYGNYTISGRISLAPLVILSWQGEDARHKEAGGVALLDVNTNRNEMEGRWYEYGHYGQREFLGGRTVWRKVS